jgi:cyclopropane fatty-acyl-phospholipid synthase-like methyltransferase
MVMAERNGEIIARGYNQVADEYQALESADAPWPRLERVLAFAADLPRGSRILDIGCGSGVPATQELACKHEVTGVDISEEQIARARSNVPTAAFICGDVRDVELPVGAFDAIVALYLVDNIASEDYPALFRRLKKLLRPKGRVLPCTWSTTSLARIIRPSFGV